MDDLEDYYRYYSEIELKYHEQELINKGNFVMKKVDGSNYKAYSSKLRKVMRETKDPKMYAIARDKFFEVIRIGLYYDCGDKAYPRECDPLDEVPIG